VRPSISEQLDGTARIVREVLAPHIDDAYAADIATGLAVTLSTLASSWLDVPAFQRWETGEITALLDAALPHLDASLAGEITAFAAAAGGDPLDLRALDARHETARRLLTGAVPAIESDGTPEELRARLHDLTRERSARFPLVAPRPSQSPPARR
jgi:hypothetical protein